MEYSIDSFVIRLRELMYQLFPYESDETMKKKHKDREGHIRDIAFMNLPISSMDADVREFNIGSDQAEEKYPYYHILQQAPVIRKKGRATDKTKGSQKYVQDLSKRDYEYVHWNGKTFSKEYSKNVRGSRSQVLKKATFVKRNANGQVMKVNRNANSYVNIHYQYIDKMLDNIAPTLANEFQMKLARKQDTGLIEEFAFQEGTDVDTIMSIFGSFME